MFTYEIKRNIGIGIIIAMLLYFLIGYITRDKTEEIRQERYAEAQEQYNTASWTYHKSKEDMDKAKSCMDANSQTGTTVDCDTLIPQVHAETWSIVEKVEQEHNERDLILMDRICKYSTINGNVSPLCWNKDLFEKLKKISIDKWVDFWLMLWIAQAESHIWANYAKWCWPEYHNLWWVKARKLDNWQTIKDQILPDSNGCWLYKFNSIEDYWESKANSLKLWYINKQCTTPECISKWYVKWNWVVKPDWSDRVRIFYN